MEGVAPETDPIKHEYKPEYKNEYKIRAFKKKFFLHISCPWVLKTWNPALTFWMVRWTRLCINLKKNKLNICTVLLPCLYHTCAKASCGEQVIWFDIFPLYLNLWKECIVTKLFGNICVKQYVKCPSAWNRVLTTFKTNLYVIVKVCNINSIMLHVESCSRESLSRFTFKSMDRKKAVIICPVFLLLFDFMIWVLFLKLN